jgi:hypothetical protein
MCSRAAPAHLSTASRPLHVKPELLKRSVDGGYDLFSRHAGKPRSLKLHMLLCLPLMLVFVAILAENGFGSSSFALSPKSNKVSVNHATAGSVEASREPASACLVPVFFQRFSSIAAARDQLYSSILLCTFSCYLIFLYIFLACAHLSSSKLLLSAQASRPP